MSLTILNVTFDCADPGAVARFWAAATGWGLHCWDVHPGAEEYSVGPPPGGGARLYFVGVPEPKTVKNRLHLDMIPCGRSQQDEMARLVALGASVLDAQPAGAGWVVMADPEGHEFCLEPGG